jgi:hypothetical protein
MAANYRGRRDGQHLDRDLGGFARCTDHRDVLGTPGSQRRHGLARDRNTVSLANSRICGGCEQTARSPVGSTNHPRAEVSVIMTMPPRTRTGRFDDCLHLAQEPRRTRGHPDARRRPWRTLPYSVRRRRWHRRDGARRVDARQSHQNDECAFRRREHDRKPPQRLVGRQRRHPLLAPRQHRSSRSCTAATRV